MKDNYYIYESFSEDKTPDMKYYAFDWDDNIVHMPTKIILKNETGEEIGMSTRDYANYRESIGKGSFYYEGERIVGYADDAFRNFTVRGDKTFLVDSIRADYGPSFDDFKDCVNGASIFAIITARGHHPNTLKEAVRNYIINGYGGIDISQLIKNLKKYRNFAGEDEMEENELLEFYLNLNKYYPVSYEQSDSAKSPEQLKLIAMDDFVSYVKEMSAILHKRAYLKNDVSNNFIPKTVKIGFSDDDFKNVKAMEKHYEDKKEKVKTIYTGKDQDNKKQPGANNDKKT